MFLEIKAWLSPLYQAFRSDVSVFARGPLDPRANMESLADMTDNEAAATFQTFYNMFTGSSLRRGDVNDVNMMLKVHTRAVMH